jgi:hypothetical protein
VPTASPAVSIQPYAHDKPKVRRKRMRVARVLTLLIALPVAASFLAADPLPVAGRSSPNDCSRWNSLTQPPPTIRVLRRKSGHIEVVNFRRYVITVMGKEWPSYLPLNVVAAGAVAVKQYAWYHSIYTSRSSDGRCFDVKDGTGDQLYKPNRARVRPDHYLALDMTWNVTLRRHGQFFMTGYRRGDKVRCGKDATGYKLFARSAVKCAEKGWGWREILRKYYGPGVDIVGDGGGPKANGSPTANSNTTSSDASSTSPAPGMTSPKTSEASGQPRSSSTTRAQADRALLNERNRLVAGSSWRRVRHTAATSGSTTSSRAAGSHNLVGVKQQANGWLEVWINNRRQQRVDLMSAIERPGVTLVQREWSR